MYACIYLLFFASIWKIVLIINKEVSSAIYLANGSFTIAPSTNLTLISNVPRNHSTLKLKFMSTN